MFCTQHFFFDKAADYNVINLDNNTLKLLTGHNLPAFVRFDRDYPYGEKVGVSLLKTCCSEDMLMIETQVCKRLFYFDLFEINCWPLMLLALATDQQKPTYPT